MSQIKLLLLLKFYDLLHRLFQMRHFLNIYMERVKRIWYLSPMRAAKVQASLAPLNGWACAVKVCHDGMLEDTNSLDGAHIVHY